MLVTTMRILTMIAALACACGGKKDPPTEPRGAGDAAPAPVAADASVATADAALPRIDRPDPPRDPGPARVTQLSLGSNFGCARMSDDTLRCWGDNGWHQLGVDPATTTPGTVVTPPVTDVVEVAAGYAFTCVRKRDRRVWCWGYDLNGELGAASGVTTHVPVQIARIEDAMALAAGMRGGCVVRTDATVGCWGDNTYGQLGDGTTTPHHGPTQALVDHASAVTVDGDTCVVRDDGSLWCWGGNQGTRPTAVTITDVVAASVGGGTSCAIKQGGAVVCWGQNDSGQLGHDGPPSAVPVEVSGLPGATQVSAQGAHVCALAGGSVWCWGAHWSNPGFARSCLQMTRHTGGGGGGGGSPAQWHYCPRATKVPGLTDVIAIDTQDHGGGCALKRDGTIACWDAKAVTPLAL